MLFIKIMLSILAVIGVFISLGEMLDWFIDKDRVNFFDAIEKQLECPKDHPGAMKFINYFLYANPDFKNIEFDMAEVEKVVFVGLWSGHSNDQARHVTSVTSGDLKLKAFNGKVTKPLCSFEDLKRWSKESPFWKWLGWGIVAASVFFGIVLLIIEEIMKRKGIKT